MVTHLQASQLLHNKFVVVLGGSTVSLQRPGAPVAERFLSDLITAKKQGGYYNALPSSSVRPVSAAPSCSANNFAMRHKHTQRQYNPYTRQKPNHPYKF